MKKYVLLATTICNMGGAQKYLQSKMLWLKEKGWLVDIVYYQDGLQILTGFDSNYSHIVKELQYPSYYYTKSKQVKIVEDLTLVLFKEVLPSDTIIIESTTIALGTWGEQIAHNTKAKHLIFSLQEKDLIHNRSVADFLIFKYKRKELAGISKPSVKGILGSFGYQISLEDSYTLDAYSSNPVEDYDYPLVERIKEINPDFIIGSIGRLDKPFVLPTIDAIIEYVKKDKEKQYVLVLVGDAPKESENRRIIEQKCNAVQNISLFVTGYIYPIPQDLVHLCDVFLSSSGSAAVSYYEGVPTISIDGNDLKPIGVVGYTTNSRLFRTDEIIRPVSDYLEEVLKLGKYPHKEPIPREAPDYSHHMSFIEEGCTKQEYYDISTLEWNKNQRIQRLLMPIIGPENYHKYISSLKSIFK